MDPDGAKPGSDIFLSDEIDGNFEPSALMDAEGTANLIGKSDSNNDDLGENEKSNLSEDGDVTLSDHSEETSSSQGQREERLPKPARQGKGGKRILGIRLFGSSMVYRLAANFPGLSPGDGLMVQTRDGEAEGRVVFISDSVYSGKNDPRKLYPGIITRIIRKLGNGDPGQEKKRRETEIKIKTLGRDLIRQAELSMKLSRVTLQPGGTKAILWFTSEIRVDFRELVKKISEESKLRIEMRHVGVRDETRLLGGVGHCGKDFCCSQYLRKFHPVSVRMAKNQELSLNPEGISGVCGRLMCCLAYENDAYTHLRDSLPAVKGNFWTKDGREVIIRSVQPLRGNVTCQYADGSRENCRAADLFAEKPANLGPLLDKREEKSEGDTEIGTSEDVRPKDQLPVEVLRQDEEGDSTDGAPEGIEKKKRSRRKKNRKKVPILPEIAGMVAGVAVRLPGHRDENFASGGDENGSVLVEEIGNGEEGRVSPSGARRRRRKKKKPSGNKANPSPVNSDS